MTNNRTVVIKAYCDCNGTNPALMFVSEEPVVQYVRVSTNAHLRENDPFTKYKILQNFAIRSRSACGPQSCRPTPPPSPPPRPVRPVLPDSFQVRKIKNK